ncbi:FecCD family ABC transporter permease [Bacillus pseudomycoides]|uniref:FecCD family ABC transporter permease n=1 Tax=Bacillus pseudomycoides TaxID=64104 RepID=UPI000BED1772|nr:iron ABC transporter permease [Bacillus pseudomycoides]PED06189.1 iron ABC transporter permease [Bacillus pseudomycoides]PEI94727.1 iron ABC transporter permease [Bacillus pseudomycoides]PEK19815.1 iron ABC transporter permease [Bacillus pseudomycoides]PEM71458.1 iron ABC transporter permease [Bacillus pseudomycoides]PEO06325.1 iron ABC transporter permease [Bacillus pseudomycoides]
MKHLFNTDKKRAVTMTAIFGCISVAVILISLNTGTLRVAPLKVFQTLFGYGDFESVTVLFDYRMPRILITMLAGIGLGVSGAILQGLSRNALADPGILGLHSGASFGLILFVTCFHSISEKASILIPLFTFGGGVLAAFLIILLANDRSKGVLPIRLILVGIAVSAGFSAITLFFSLRLSDETYTFASRWLVGNVWGRDWIHVVALLPWIFVLAPYTWLKSKTLNALALGDEVAAGLGVSVQKERLLLLAIAVGLSCASVSMAGGIGFIGLVSPHVARRLAGSTYQHFLPLAGLTGLIILVLADTIGRSLFEPNSIPAGVVVAALGAPYFLYVLTKTK